MTANSSPDKMFKSRYTHASAQPPPSVLDDESLAESDEVDGMIKLSLKGSQSSPPQEQQTQMLSELEQHYDKNIRPLLDMVDRLRTVGIMEEGIQLPSIVVVGDQSSGKSSVLESLASINLPRGQGIATRVPLILRLQRCPPNEAPSITIECEGVEQQIAEQDIKSAVDNATTVLAGDGKGITDRPISLHIRKPTAPDLTMIDLPGITRVPVHGQPDDIYEQISAMIRHYIQPKESVILNVLSATVDFSTCESIRMSQKEDKAGERTLAVVTKVDLAPDGLYEKVTVDEVNIGLGYVCVKNRADEEESHEDARRKEESLFECHPSLQKLDKDMVGISALAERLTIIQANMIRTCLPGIVKKIEGNLVDRRKELQSLPEGVADALEAETVFLRIMMEKRMTLERLVVHGDFQGYTNDRKMHYTARLQEFFTSFSDVLHASGKTLRSKEKTKEILELMVEGQGVNLPNFLNGSVFHNLVREQIQRITLQCQHLVTTIHQYVQEVVFTVIDQHAGSFASMRSAYRRSAERVLGKTRDDCMAFVNRELEKESSIIYTINDYYMENIRKIRERGIRDKPAIVSSTSAVPSVPVPRVFAVSSPLQPSSVSPSIVSPQPFATSSSVAPVQPFSASSSAASQPFAASSSVAPVQPSSALSSAASTQTFRPSSTAASLQAFRALSTPVPLQSPAASPSPAPKGTNSSFPLPVGSLSSFSFSSYASPSPAPKGTSSNFPPPLGSPNSVNNDTEDEYSLEEDPGVVSSSSKLSSASNDFQSAQEMRVNLVAYWKVVHKRLADGITFELRYAFQCAILKDLYKDVLREKTSKGVLYMLKEDVALAKKRRYLKQRVDVLQESYGLVSDLLKW